MNINEPLQIPFHELLNYSKKDNNRSYVLQMHNNKNRLMGFQNVPEELDSAVIFIKTIDGYFIKGNLNTMKFNKSTISQFNVNDTFYFGVDSRDKTNHLFYIHCENFYDLIDSRTLPDMENSIYNYWEGGGLACLSIAGYDPINNVTNREVCVGHTAQQINFLRTIMFHTLIGYAHPSYIANGKELHVSGEPTDYDY